MLCAMANDLRVYECLARPHLAYARAAAARGSVAGWRLVAQGRVGSVVVVLILPISDDDAGVGQ